LIYNETYLNESLSTNPGRPNKIEMDKRVEQERVITFASTINDLIRKKRKSLWVPERFIYLIECRYVNNKDKIAEKSGVKLKYWA
jgi:hypothetical protein